MMHIPILGCRLGIDTGKLRGLSEDSEWYLYCEYCGASKFIILSADERFAKVGCCLCTRLTTIKINDPSYGWTLEINGALSRLKKLIASIPGAAE